MTAIFFTDAYADVPTSPRERIEHELRRLKVMLWADGASDDDLKKRIAEAEAALRAFDQRERTP